MKVEKSVLWLCLLLAKIFCAKCSPPLHHNWTRSEKMDSNGILQMQWHLRDKEIVFRVTVNSRGFVALGFLYQNPKISGFDMALAWIHDRTGKANILVGFFFFAYVCIKFTRNICNTVDTTQHKNRSSIMKNEECVFLRIYFRVSVLQ